MLTATQRKQLLQYSGLLLVAASFIAVLAHKLFLVALPYYLSLAIISYLTHIGYRYSREIWHW